MLRKSGFFAFLLAASVLHADVKSAPPACSFMDSASFFVDGSFLYWYTQEDGMDFALPSASVTNPSSPPPSLIYAAKSASYQFPDFAYQPGFRAGLGFSSKPKEWKVFLEYTYLHQQTNTSLGNPPADSRGTAVWSLSNWFGNSYPFTTSGIATKWRTDLDVLDLSVSYPCFQRKSGMIAPFAGLRGVRLYQNFRVEANVSSAGIEPAISKNKSTFWGIGPRMGVQGQLFLGAGFRLEASVDGSLVFAEFDASHNDNLDISYSSPDLLTGGTSFKYNDYKTLRFLADMALGAGWKTTFYKSYYFDLLASYEFFLMPSQNAMRQINNAYDQGIGMVPAGDFTLQGLTIKAMVGF